MYNLIWKIIYYFFGYFIRREACRLAALTIKEADIQNGYTPNLWSLAVFYEMYLVDGSQGTEKDFGPKEPIELKEVINE